MIMNKIGLVFLPVVAVLLFLTTYVGSLKCVECLNCILDLPEATDCSNRLGNSINDGDHYPTCMKMVTKYNDREVVTRQCSPAPRNMEPLCSEKEGFEQCIYHCHTDGCNGAQNSMSGGKVTSWLALLVCLAFRLIHI